MESTHRLARALLVHDAEDVAQGLLAAAETLPAGTTLPLLSAPGAAHWLSPRLFLAIVTRGARGTATQHLPVLDCAGSPGHALAALRAGCPALVLHDTCPAFASLASAAAEAGACLWPTAPDALDMATLRAGTPRGAARLRDWLRG